MAIGKDWATVNLDDRIRPLRSENIGADPIKNFGNTQWPDQRDRPCSY